MKTILVGKGAEDIHVSLVREILLHELEGVVEVLLPQENVYKILVTGNAKNIHDFNVFLTFAHPARMISMIAPSQEDSKQFKEGQSTSKFSSSFIIIMLLTLLILLLLLLLILSLQQKS